MTVPRYRIVLSLNWQNNLFNPPEENSGIIKMKNETSKN